MSTATRDRVASFRPETLALLAEFDASGLTAAAFARERGVPPWKIYHALNGRRGKALGYLRAQRKPLSAFRADARLPIHNNDAERDRRHVVVGSKNWMIFASPKGGELACRLYSLVLSCKQSDVDPEAYIEDLLARVDTTPASQIATLTPWAWAEAHRKAAGDAT
ncbi:MAG TPA: transposase [Planctomycetota bacterium]|nr:transposase [Planctomycetota bacterium]